MRRLLPLLVLVSGCSSMSPSDQQAWVGQPVAELDTNTQLLTLPVKVTNSSNGLEVRTYSLVRQIDGCDSYTAGKNTHTSCSTDKFTCNFIFYVKGGHVVDMTPVGHCINQTVKPQGRWQRL